MIRHVLFIVVVFSCILYWLVDSRQEALAACKSAGVQSDATCEANI
jgi:hypothetical protein